jgi:hypothetical protein
MGESRIDRSKIRDSQLQIAPDHPILNFSHFDFWENKDGGIYLHSNPNHPSRGVVFFFPAPSSEMIRYALGLSEVDPFPPPSPPPEPIPEIKEQSLQDQDSNHHDEQEPHKENPEDHPEGFQEMIFHPPE